MEDPFDFAAKYAAFMNWLVQSGGTTHDNIAVEDLRYRGSGWGVSKFTTLLCMRSSIFSSMFSLCGFPDRVLLCEAP